MVDVLTVVVTLTAGLISATPVLRANDVALTVEVSEPKI